MFLSRLLIALLSILALTSQSVLAVSYPSTGPGGSYSGGTFGTYLQNLFTNPCPNGEAVVGFSTGSTNYGEPICSSVGLAAGSLGDTLRFDGSSWVANDIIYNDGVNVGIGDSSPASKLDVRGILTVNPNAFGDAINFYNGYKIRTVGGGGLQLQGSPYVAIGNTSGINGATFSVGDIGAATLTLYPDAGQDGFEISGYNFIVDSSGRLGLGNLTPNAKLDIASTIDNAIRINKTGGTNWSYMEWLYGGTRRFWQGLNSSGNYALQSDSSTGQIFISGSRISIGVDTPQYRLDVAPGYVNSASGYCIGGDCIPAWSSVGDFINGNPGYLAGYDFIGTLGSSNTYQSGNQLYIGDVAYILSGSMTNLGQLTIYSATPTSATNPMISFGQPGYPDCKIWVNASSVLESNCSFGILNTTLSLDPNQIVRTDAYGTGLAGSVIYESGSNIGIGTTTPGARLEVNGQIKVTGGSPGAGKILTSDATGLASWQTPGAVSFTGVVSFNGRTGAVIGASGDYTAGQITNVAGGNIIATNLQSAINELDSEKQVVITGAATSVTLANLLANAALVSDAGGKISASATISSTELGYLDNISSNIQTQIDAKEPTITAGVSTQYYRGDKTWQTLNTAAVTEGSNLYYTNARVWASLSGAISPYLTGNLTPSRALASDTNGKLSVANTTLTELNYVNGVTSSIQTQLNSLSTNKANLASPNFTGTPTVPTAATGANDTQIANTAFVNTAITNGIASGALVGNFWYLSGNTIGANDFIGTKNARDLRFVYSGSEGMRLSQTGLSVNSALQVGRALYVSNTPGGTNTLYGPAAGFLVLGVNNSTAMTINSSNNVGIGPLAPTRNFEVSAGDQLTFRLNSGNASLWDFYMSYGIDNNLYVNPYTGTGNFIFSGTNVGIGTVAATERLTVAGTGSFQGLRLTSGASNGYILTSDASGNARWAPAGGSVSSVFGRTGAVIGASGDYTAGQITNIAAGNIAATNLQAAINELDTEKEPSLAAGVSTQYYRGDKTWQTLNTAAVTESTNLYFTNARVAGALTGAISNTLTGNLTTNSALISDAGGKIAISPTVSSTELGYLDGVTSALQPQLNARWSLSGNAIGVNDFIGTTNTRDFIIKVNNIEHARFIGTGSIILGRGNSYSGEYSTILGYQNALNTQSIASNIGNTIIGYGNSFTGGTWNSNNTLIGSNNIGGSSFGGMTVVGRSNTSNGFNGVILGVSNNIPSNWDESVLVGISNTTNGHLGNAFGYGNTVGGYSYAIGMNNTVNGYSYVLGLNNVSSAFGAIIIGSGITNNIANSIQIGPNDSAKITVLSGGQVGIGTSSPTAKLEVVGTIKITGGSPGAGRVLTSDATGLASWQSLSGASVSSVFGRTGSIIGASGDYTAGQITNVAVGNIAATNVQAALNELDTEKQVTITGAASTVTLANLTANSALVSDAGGKIGVSPTISSTELGYLDNATSNIQTQIDSKLNSGSVSGTSNYISKFNGANSITNSQIYDNGTTVGIGIAPPPGPYKLNVNGNAYIAGDLTLTGSLYVDNIVNRNVTNLTISGNILPDSNAPLSYRNIGSDSTRWNNLYLSGQITIGGGSPGAGKVLVSDANGLASWVWASATVWTLSGNAIGANDFIGSTNAQPFIIRTNNIERARFFSGPTNNAILSLTGGGISITGSAIIIGDTSGNRRNNKSIDIQYERSNASQIADGTGVIVIGARNLTSTGYETLILGTANSYSGVQSGWGPSSGDTVIGHSNILNSGYGNTTLIGANNVYGGSWGTLVGRNNVSAGAFDLSTAFGAFNTIGYHRAVIVGNYNTAGENSIVVGANNNILEGSAGTDYNMAFGIGNNVTVSNGFPFQTNIALIGLNNTGSANGVFVFGSGITNSVNGSVQIGTTDTGKITLLSSGELGIGTTIPTSKLDVVGTGTFQNLRILSGASNGFVLTSDASGNARWAAATGGNSWSLSGNSIGVNDFIGSTNAQDLVFKANNFEMLRIRYTDGDMIMSGSFRIGRGGGGQTDNTALGYNALATNATGTFNTAIGYNALTANTSGSSNVALGSSSLRFNTIGDNNVALGMQALQQNTTGTNNMAMGRAALRNNQTGASNVAIGWSALLNSTASYNLAIGSQALTTNTTGGSNVAIGSVALRYNATGSFNVALGGGALTNSLGDGNIGIGWNAGSNITTGSSNIAIGNGVQVVSNTDSNQLNIGNWIYGSGGNIGIGTSTGTAKLEIAGQIKITGGVPGAGKVLTSDATGLATWQSMSGTSVSSVFGRTGAVLGASGDYTAGQITNVPAGSIASTNVQAAINELDTEKEPSLAAGVSTQYYRGDKTWQTLNTTAVTEGTNLYFTNARVGAALTGAISNTLTGNLTASRALASDAGGKISVATTTLTELNYVNGVTSSIQAQLNNKISTGSISGSTNYLPRFSGTNALTNSQLFDNGTAVGIGTASPGAYKLNVNGNTYIAGDLSLTGRLYVDTIVNRTVTNISVSGGILPDTAAPLSVRNLGSNGTRWNNLYLSGQITIGGGSPGVGKYLTSDANGLASWTTLTIPADAVTSVFGRTGTVIGSSGDYTAGQITNIAAGNIAATNLQAAINELDTEKQVTITGAASSVTLANLTANSALISDATGKIAISPTISSTELSYLDNATSNIQTQLNTRWTLSGNSVGANDFIGSTNGQDVVIKSNNIERWRFSTGGNIYANGAVSFLNTSQNSVFIGNAAGVQVSGNYHTVIGGLGGGSIMSGTYNTVLGGNSAGDRMGGDYNTAIGGGAAGNFMVGTYNVAIGSYAGYNMSGANNVYIGTYAIGNGSQNNQFSLGNVIYGSGMGTGGLANGMVGIGTMTPTDKLTVVGTGSFQNLRILSGASNGFVLTSDAVGNARWAPAATGGWGLTGNAGTNPSTNFLGTTDSQDFVIRANNNQVARFYTGGNLNFGLQNTLINALRSTVIGYNNSYTGSASYDGDTVIGYNNRMTNGYGAGLVVGSANISTSSNGITVGSSNNVNGDDSTVFGRNNTLGTHEAILIGASNNVSGGATYSWSLGYGYGNIVQATVNSSPVSVFGRSNTGSTGNVVAFGNYNNVIRQNSTAVGQYNNVTTSGSSVFGSFISNAITGSTMIGPNDTAKVTILSSGDLGIGTSAPTSKLDVVGTGTFQGLRILSGASNGFVLTSDAVGNARWAAATGGSGGSSGWSLSGNTIGANDFIGTTNDQDLILKRNNVIVANFSTGGNLALGESALVSNTTGNFNVAIGIDALFSNTTGNFNTANGVYALFSNITGTGNVALGYESLRFATGSSFQTAIGYQALRSNTSGYENIALGSWALTSNTTGYQNVAIGSGALSRNTSGQLNIALGNGALRSNTNGSSNTAIGHGPLTANTSGYRNTAIGLSALLSTTSGYENTAVGNWSLMNNTGGIRNVALGVSAGQGNITGQGNTAIGFETLLSSTGVSYQTAVGFQALRLSTAGTGNTALGYSAGSAITTGANNIAIGYNAQVQNGTASNQMNIGNWIYGSGGNIGIGATTPSQKLEVSGNVLATSYMTSSDRNLKENIIPLPDALAKILSLGGYSFSWKADGREDIGIIAQDVEAVYPEIVHTDPTTGTKSVEYSNLIAPMIEAMREQQNMIEKQQREIDELKTAIQLIQSSLNR